MATRSTEVALKHFTTLKSREAILLPRRIQGVIATRDTAYIDRVFLNQLKYFKDNIEHHWPKMKSTQKQFIEAWFKAK